ncbi:MAG TPA: deoxyribonuclease IV [Gemmatimonadales bacterium]|nr:deoxyribonuclease IV [Gemmatimonadales bacterium]
MGSNRIRRQAHILGAHTIDAGGIDQAVRRAARAGMRTVQIFSAIPKYYGDRVSIRPERVQRFRRAVDECGLALEHVVVHAAYVLNFAAADEEKRVRAAGGLLKELERSTSLGIGGVCFHPGAATDGDRETGIARVAAAMTFALDQIPGTTRLWVENTAGAGATLGRTAAEVGAILALLPERHRGRTGYGLDTCHLFASGYDITESADAFRRILDDFQEAAGGPPAFFHLNDSAGALGSNFDRHKLIGEGAIGMQPFRWLLADDRSRGVPLILETPQQNLAIAGEDLSPDPWDVRMMELLSSLT